MKRLIAGNQKPLKVYFFLFCIHIFSLSFSYPQPFLMLVQYDNVSQIEAARSVDYKGGATSSAVLA